jgi:small subunit ribosomal protein S3
MGQKVHPYGLRLGIIRPWLSRWYAEDARYREQVVEDSRLRKLLRSRLRNASISQIAIERNADTVTIIVHTAKPGVVIGRSGSGVERLNRDIQQLIKRKVHLAVEEVKRPELDAQLVADSIANQIERRISFRRAMRQAVQRTVKAGAEGVRIKVSGRLGGAEIAHSETTKSLGGRVPLHTLRADIDYGLAEAKTTHGNIGVKVWIYKGEIIRDRKRRQFEEARDRAETPGERAGRSRRGGGRAAAAAPAPAEPVEQAEPAEPVEEAPAAELVAEAEPVAVAEVAASEPAAVVEEFEPLADVADPEEAPEATAPEGDDSDVDA